MVTVKEKPVLICECCKKYFETPTRGSTAFQVFCKEALAKGWGYKRISTWWIHYFCPDCKRF